MKSATWLLLLYGLPTRRNSARVSLWRKLKKFGAVQLKTSAYLLPDQPVNYERFQWLAKQIQDDSGDATLIRVAQIEGFSHRQIVELFNNARAREYKTLMESLRVALAQGKKRRDSGTEIELEKFRRQLNDIKQIDYFGTPVADEAQVLLNRAEKLLAGRAVVMGKHRFHPGHYQGKTWLTRPRPEVDRVGSAWLIRRFIDRKAKFVFAAEASAYPQAIPFDMFGADFSHHGDYCTFETFLKRFGIQDKALRQIAEMVHDADLEDGKFQRSECIGLDRILKGWAKAGLSDGQIIKRGGECFEALYQQIGK